MASIILYTVYCILSTFYFIFTKLLIFCINSRFSSKQNYKRRKFKTHIKKRGNNERALG